VSRLDYVHVHVHVHRQDVVVDRRFIARYGYSELVGQHTSVNRVYLLVCQFVTTMHSTHNKGTRRSMLPVCLFVCLSIDQQVTTYRR